MLERLLGYLEPILEIGTGEDAAPYENMRARILTKLILISFVAFFYIIAMSGWIGYWPLVYLSLGQSLMFGFCLFLQWRGWKLVTPVLAIFTGGLFTFLVGWLTAGQGVGSQYVLIAISVFPLLILPRDRVFLQFAVSLFVIGLSAIVVFVNPVSPMALKLSPIVTTGLLMLSFSLIVIFFWGSVIFLFRELELMKAKELESQKQIMNSAKLIDLGIMAGGVAHEINNPLAVIRLNTEMMELSSKQGTSPESKAFLDYGNKISMMVTRIDKIVRAMLHLSRDSELDGVTQFHPRAVIEDVIQVSMEKLKRYEIQVTIEGDEGVQPIEFQSTQFGQVLLNLLANSVDAIQSLEEKWVKFSIEDSVEQIRIQVTDSGPGISKDVAEKILTPFFTTKEVGRGTGLGLSLASSIMTKHGGSLSYDPTSQHTCFVLTLPRHHVPQPNAVA